MSKPQTANPVNSKLLIGLAQSNKAMASALQLVTKVYKNDKREHTGIPYSSHALTMVSVLHPFELSMPALVAAVLADTLSRKAVKYETLVEQFGPDVADMVKALTPVRKEDGQLDVEAYKAQLSAASPEVQSIKLADLLDHICAIPAKKLAASFELFNLAEALLPALGQGDPELLRRVLLSIHRARA